MLAVSIHTIPCAWTALYINVRDQNERKQFFQAQLRDLSIDAVQIMAVDTSQIKNAQYDVTIVDKHDESSGSGAYKDHMNHIYSKAEISLIMSFKRAMSVATMHPPPYIVFEDDVVIRTSFADMISSIDSAPEDWQILQYHVQNKAGQRSFCNLTDPFVNWMPEYYSTAVTVIRNAKTAADIVTREVTGHHVLDYWLYNSFQTYTNTQNRFLTRSFPIRINQNANYDYDYDQYLMCAKPPLPTSIPHKIALSSVTTSSSMFNRIWGNLILPSHVHLHVIIRITDLALPRIFTYMWITEAYSENFSKWKYFRRLFYHLNKRGGYTHFLFSDDDISFRGFPWVSFSSYVSEHDPLITGIPKESEFANSIVNIGMYYAETRRDFFTHSNGDFWRNIDNDDEHRWSFLMRRFGRTRISPFKLRFLEQGVTLFETKFLNWYFHRTRTIVDKMENMKTDWVIDAMWCSAVHDFNHSKMCTVFPYPVWHHDLGTLTNHWGQTRGSASRNFERRGHKLMRWAKRNPTYLKWIQWARDDMSKFSKLSNYDPSVE